MTHDNDGNSSPLAPDIMRTLEPDRLPRPEIERQILSRLRAEGLLDDTLFEGRRNFRRWIVGAIAAGLAFAVGVGVGRTGGATAPRGVEAAISAAGEQYVAALARAEPTHGAARNAALASFREVAEEISRLMPDNESVSIVMTALDGSVIRGPLLARPAGASLRVVWH